MAFTVLQVGPETLVNTTTAHDQQNSGVTRLSDGGWVVTWESTNQDGSGSGIYQQRYNSDGSRNGGEVQVNTWTPNSQSDPSITLLSNGGWVVTWTSYGQLTGTEYETSTSIFQQCFNADGTRSGTEVRVNTTLTGNQQNSSVTLVQDGRWIVTWESVGQDGSGSGIYQQIYNADGSQYGGETRVNRTTADQQQAPSVTALSDPDGGWLVTWQSLSQDGSSYGIYQQRYNRTGIPFGPEKLINTVTEGPQRNPSATVLSDGGWVVTWQSLDEDGSGYGIYQQRYDAEGAAVEGPARVNTVTSDDQIMPSVTALADGGWLVAWQSSYQDSVHDADIYQQRYHADGSAAGPETRINVTTDLQQYFARVTSLEDNSWVVTWTSTNNNGAYNFDVYQRQFKAVQGETLTQTTELVTGTDLDEVLSVGAGGLNAGDVIEAKGGRDVLVMSAAGAMDLRAADILTGFEVLHGSSGDDVVISNAARLESFTFIDGKGGRNVLQLTGTGEVYDFRDKAVLNFASIKFSGAGNTQLIAPDKNTALVVSGTDNAGEKVKLAAGIFTAEERARLFAQGIDTVEDGSGVYNAPPPNGAPTSIAPATFTVQEMAGSGTVLGTLAATDPNPGDTFSYTLLDSADGRFKIVNGQLLVDNSFKLDFEQASSHVIKVQVADRAGATQTQNLTVNVGDWRGETTAGTAGNDVFKGGIGNDRLSGNAGNDRLFGGVDNDILRGEAGNDIIGGGEGRDQLHGSRGAGSRDAFLFDTKLTSKTAAGRHKDVINDFGSRYDSIYLDDAAFGNTTIARFLRGKGAALDKPIKMKNGFFKVGTKAEDRDDYFIFNRSNKKLYWDADGSGRKAMVEIATLKLQNGEGTTLTYHDFYFV